MPCLSGNHMRNYTIYRYFCEGTDHHYEYHRRPGRGGPGHQRDTARYPLGPSGGDAGRASLYRHRGCAGASGHPADLLRQLCEGGNLPSGVRGMHFYQRNAGAQADRQESGSLPHSDSAVHLCGYPAFWRLGDYRGAAGIYYYISDLFELGEEAGEGAAIIIRRVILEVEVRGKEEPGFCGKILFISVIL